MEYSTFVPVLMVVGLLSACEDKTDPGAAAGAGAKGRREREAAGHHANDDRR